MAWAAAAPYLAAAAGSVVGNLLGNKANAKASQKQMDFQERMSNTSLQRSAKDAEAAGLNRILAFNNAASTPSGSTFTSDFGDMGVGAGMNAMSTAQQIKASKTQQQLMTEQSNAQSATAKAALAAEEKTKIEAQQMRELLPFMKEIQRGQAESARTQAILNEANIENIREQARVNRVEAQKSEFYGSPYFSRAAKGLVEKVSNGLNSAYDSASPLVDKVRRGATEYYNSAKQYREAQNEKTRR